MKYSSILFDLDNTLYPESAGVQAEISKHINAYTARFLSISEEEAYSMRTKTLAEHGTTLRWLQSCYNFQDTEDYIERVHPLYLYDLVSTNQTLISFLQTIECPIHLITNAPIEHAERMMSALGIDGLFQSYYDIRVFDFKGKPHRSAYEKVIEEQNLTVESTLLVEDSLQNLRGFREIGGQGVWVDERKRESEFPVFSYVHEIDQLWD